MSIDAGIDAAAHGEDALEAATIVAGLSAASRSELAALDVLASIDSTNSELLRRPAAEFGASVLFAERQTGGRGRQGRVWVSPPACNLYVSIARRFAVPLDRIGGLGLAVGVAVAEALHALGVDAIGLKWPNDLVLADGEHLRKLGGILIESGGRRNGAVQAVIGLGLNVRMSEAASAPAETTAIAQPWTDLRQCLGERTPPRNHVAAAVLDTLLPALAAFERDGLAPALARYAQFDILRGRTIETLGTSPPMVGVAEGIADDGALRLRTAQGEQQLRAGEVSVRMRCDESSVEKPSL